MAKVHAQIILYESFSRSNSNTQEKGTLNPLAQQVTMIEMSRGTTSYGVYDTSSDYTEYHLGYTMLHNTKLTDGIRNEGK